MFPSAPEGNNFKRQTLKSKALMEEQETAGNRVELGAKVEGWKELGTRVGYRHCFSYAEPHPNPGFIFPHSSGFRGKGNF